MLQDLFQAHRGNEWGWELIHSREGASWEPAGSPPNLGPNIASQALENPLISGVLDRE